ncbi:hypothetical protein FRN05_17405 [Salmonella enterica subsp. enterica]|nr:hypothetical protein [Salmonella enterica subsp. enterica serovar Meleagridis]
MHKAKIISFFIAIFLLIAACYFSLRNMVALLFVIPVFLVISSMILSIAQKAEFSVSLSKSEIRERIFLCYIGIALIPGVVNFCFLYWVNSHSSSPLWGDRYEEYTYNEEVIKTSENEIVKSISTAQVAVKGLLKDPSSAKFSGDRLARSGAVCGYVDAKNSFGVYTGKERYVYSGGAYLDDKTSDFSIIWQRSCK